MNRKKKILFVTEASIKSTGYSVYSREILQRLHSSGHFEVAELACFCDPSEDLEAIKRVPWLVMVNKPSDPAELEVYESNPGYEFGEFSFNAALLKFQPDFVMDVRDWWMHEHQQRTRSVFRDYYKWVPMPTVDAMPQNDQWIESYTDADAVFTYSEFGRDVLLDQSDRINFIDICSPAASESFRNIPEAREVFGVDENAVIYGTVMRNQKRKLYPELFRSFSKFIAKNKANKNAFLYCHTYFPDLGWDIPKLLIEYNLTGRVLFSYKCNNCGNLTCNFFQDVNTHCPKCGHFKLSLVGVDNPINEEELAYVYNVFDVYVQYASNEGFGMPQIEAAYCETPVITVNYSAMQSLGVNIEASMIPLLDLQYEAETGLKKAIPDPNEAADIFQNFYNMSREERTDVGKKTEKLARKYYNWDAAANKWINFFLNEPVISEDMSTTWLSPPKIEQAAPPIPKELTSPKDQATYLFSEVLRKPQWVYGYMWRKLIRDLTYRAHMKSITNEVFYFNEMHIRDNRSNFTDYNKDKAYKQMCNSREMFNKWEKTRWDMLSNER